MRRRTIAAVVALWVTAAAGCTGRTSTESVVAVQASYVASLDSALAGADSARVRAQQSRWAESRVALQGSRRPWKRAEYLAEFYYPLASRSVNGPPVPWVEDDDPNHIVHAPEGFQAAAGALASAHPDPTRTTHELAVLGANLRRVRAVAAATPLSVSNVFDATRLELFRISALGIAGYDAASTSQALEGAAAALRGVADATRIVAGNSGRDDTTVALLAAAAVLDSVTGPDEFDRLAFLVDRLIPAARALAQLQRETGAQRPATPRSWIVRADFPTDSGAIDPLDFAQPDANASTPARRALGSRLFFDATLSGSRTRSCAGCHRPGLAFSDGQVLAAAVGGGTLSRNTPTLLNAALQTGSFYDLRTSFLEDQARDVIENAREMHGSLGTIAVTLSHDTRYTAAFSEAFGAAGDSTVTERRLRRAVADYVRSLVALNAPFDRYLRGERSAMDESARRGFNLFMGKARCGSCHFFPLFNGALPPGYTDTELEVLGLPAHSARPWVPDADSGHARVNRSPIYLGAMKTTTIRNADRTAPYMHNGVFATLDAVIDFYDGGGGRGHGLVVPNQTLPADSLHLLAREKRELIAFIRALTDSSGTAPLARRAIASQR